MGKKDKSAAAAGLLENAPGVPINRQTLYLGTEGVIGLEEGRTMGCR